MRPVHIGLLVAMTGLLGWAAQPKRLPPKPAAPASAEAEDEELIAALSVWRARAMAEQQDFLRSLDLMQGLVPAGTPGPKAGGE